MSRFTTYIQDNKLVLLVAPVVILFLYLGIVSGNDHRREPTVTTVRYAPGDGLRIPDFPVYQYNGPTDKTNETLAFQKDGYSEIRRPFNTEPDYFVSDDGETKLELVRVEPDGTLVAKQTTYEWVDK